MIPDFHKIKLSSLVWDGQVEGCLGQSSGVRVSFSLILARIHAKPSEIFSLRITQGSRYRLLAELGNGPLLMTKGKRGETYHLHLNRYAGTSCLREAKQTINRTKTQGESKRTVRQTSSQKNSHQRLCGVPFARLHRIRKLERFHARW